MNTKRTGGLLGALLLLAGFGTVLVLQHRTITTLRSDLRDLEGEVDRLIRDQPTRRSQPEPAPAPAARQSKAPNPAQPSEGGSVPAEVQAGTGVVNLPASSVAAATAAAAGSATSERLVGVASGPVRLVSKPGSHVVVAGTSSIHDWTVEGAIIKGWIEVEPGFPALASPRSSADAGTNASAARAEISIPIRSLKSGKQKMDEIMQEAMHAGEHPDITYHLVELTPAAGDAANDSPRRFATTGTLTVNGVTRDCDFDVSFAVQHDGKWRFSGGQQLKMTDFGITPPAPSIPGMAAITTGDAVTVTFDWVVAPARPTTP